jgi:hypothetical protein
MNLKQQSIKYFNFFSSKNLSGLKSIYGKNITLKDWVVERKKFSSVIKLNKKTFNKFKKINVKIKEIFTNHKMRSVACKITIKFDKIRLNVIDLIYFNKNKKILKIEAYKL